MSEGLPREDGRALVAIARAAIARRLGVEAPEPPPSGPALRERRGAFVTLRRREDGELRGCVGFIEARQPLCEAVARAAELAAFEDGRFHPVAAAELAGLVLDVSVLSPLRPIAPEAIQVGVHGLLIRHAGRSGLLLPVVPLQFGWDRETFLEQTCRKAGLPRDAWKEPGAELLAFTAEVVDEE
ncbi:MAG TPA: AmmeMemoRadiSam system protein A [Vicinamibacteria bacterium]|nr:AmmeMemoRadiSam system protein A [Vicinamibacteria bacterium]